MDWSRLLDGDEQLLWEGRPAPRCYTFRHWIHSVFGLILLAPSLVWLDGGQTLADKHDEALWSVLPWLGVVVSGYFLFGHLLVARLDWEGVFYAITDRRVIAVGGWPRRRLRSIPVEHLRHLRLRPKGNDLGSLHLGGSSPEERCAFSCLEHPARAVALLEDVVHRNLSRIQEPSPGDKV